jgi:hypothetical protein
MIICLFLKVLPRLPAGSQQQKQNLCSTKLAEVFCLKWVNYWVKTFCFVMKNENFIVAVLGQKNL